MSLNMSFPILEIFVPLICFCVVILCCNTSCRALQRAREERQLQQNNRDAENPSVYIIPFPSLPSDDDLHRPPRYSIARSMSPPPPYHELEIKPAEFYITDDVPPPPYVPPLPDPPPASATGS